MRFQSPPFGASHCNPTAWYPPPLVKDLSVPSIRGKPLQFGIREKRCAIGNGLSVPSIRGKPLQCPFVKMHPRCFPLRLSVPSIRGKPLQLSRQSASPTHLESFSPLHSGQATAIESRSPHRDPCGDFQSPPFGASHCNQVAMLHDVRLLFAFSPLHSGQATAMAKRAEIR